MRETLFRGKRHENIQGDNSWHYSGIFRNDEISDINHSTIVQYTGMLDWFHKRIFVGDILQTANNELCVIKETTNGWGLFNINKNGKNGNHKTLNYIHTYKIIGNIYDNPELLK